MGKFLVVPLLKKNFAALKMLWQDKKAKKRYKLLMVFGGLYILWPFDLIPMPIFGISIIDDIIVCFGIWNLLKPALKKYQNIYEGKEVIDNVNYDIKEEEAK